MESTLVVPGLSFPFFPPRPIKGVALTAETIRGYVETHSSRYHLQKKLNGDRTLALVRDGRVHLLNRHGRFFCHPVANQKLLLQVPDNTLLDGEVRDKTFHPFEVVVLGGQSYLRECPSVRSLVASSVAQSILKQPYLFAVEEGYLERLRDNWPLWEGIVRKKLGSPYAPLGSDTQTTPTWFKNKWLNIA